MKNALLDTSFLNSARDNKISINDEFPESQYVRWVQDTVIDEFFLNEKKEWHDRKINAAFFKQSKLKLQRSADEILYHEYLGQIQDYLFKPIKKEQEIQPFLEGTHPHQQKKEKEYFEKLNDRILAKDQQWNLIPVYDNDVICLDVDVIKSVIDQQITHKIPCTIPLDTTGMNSLRIVGNKTFLSRNDKVIDRKHHVKIFKNIKNELPSIYNMLVYAVFMDYVARPKTIYTDRIPENIIKPFKIQIASKVQIEKNNYSKELDHIEISKNHLPDFRIILPSLAYIDTFATCDIYLVALIKYLFPQYANKLKLF